MNGSGRAFAAIAFALIVCSGTHAALAGPPYQTDDPDPVAYRNYEIYVGATDDPMPGADSVSSPFVEVNFGPLPNVQIAASIPFAITRIVSEPFEYGIGDIDAGIKYRFSPESATRPMISFYPSVELPTGSQRDPTDSHTPKIFLPLWAQKTTGKTTIFGGGGWERNQGALDKNFWTGGIADTYQFTSHVNAGVELYGNTAEQLGERGSACIGIGMNNDYSEMHSFVVSLGTSFAGQRAFHVYIAYELRFRPKAP